MPFCTQCGKEIRDTDKFCTNCGKQIIRNNSVAAAPSPEPVKPVEPVEEKKVEPVYGASLFEVLSESENNVNNQFGVSFTSQAEFAENAGEVYSSVMGKTSANSRSCKIMTIAAGALAGIALVCFILSYFFCLNRMYTLDLTVSIFTVLFAFVSFIFSIIGISKTFHTLMKTNKVLNFIFMIAAVAIFVCQFTVYPV